MAPSPDRDADASDSADQIDSVEDDGIVEAIRAAPKPVVNTRYLALELGVPSEALLDRLRSLVDEGRLEHLEVRGRGHLWYRSLDEELGA